MQQVDTNQLIPKASAVFTKIIHFFGRPEISIPRPDQSPRPDRIPSNIDWPDSESSQPSNDGCIRPGCGGYNEAFIVQYWASYHIR